MADATGSIVVSEKESQLFDYCNKTHGLRVAPMQTHALLGIGFSCPDSLVIQTSSDPKTFG